MRIPQHATREAIVGLNAGIARSDELQSQGFHVEERLDRVSGELILRLYYWRPKKTLDTFFRWWFKGIRQFRRLGVPQ